MHGRGPFVCALSVLFTILYSRKIRFQVSSLESYLLKNWNDENKTKTFDFFVSFFENKCEHLLRVRFSIEGEIRLSLKVHNVCIKIDIVY